MSSLPCCEIDNKIYLIHLKSVNPHSKNIIFTIYKNEINVLFKGSLVHSIHQHREPLCLTLLYWALAELAVHAANIASHSATTLWSVVDLNQNLPPVSPQYQARQQSLIEAMTDPDVHAVLIASATDTHADLIEMAARHGKSHLL